MAYLNLVLRPMGSIGKRPKDDDYAGRLSVATLQRLEAGDPEVGIGTVATALWLIQRAGVLSQAAAPEHDQGALELDVREAVALGRARALASADSRIRADRKKP